MVLAYCGSGISPLRLPICLPGEVATIMTMYLQETTLSVNHNWFNGCNAEKCWNYLKYNLQLVEKEISEFKDSMTDWESHCQVSRVNGPEM